METTEYFSGDSVVSYVSPVFHRSFDITYSGFCQYRKFSQYLPISKVIELYGCARTSADTDAASPALCWFNKGDPFLGNRGCIIGAVTDAGKTGNAVFLVNHRDNTAQYQLPF